MRRKKSTLSVRDVIEVRSEPSLSPELESIWRAWDILDSAINAVECALPRQMTEAAAALEMERQKMRNVMRAATQSLMGMQKAA